MQSDATKDSQTVTSDGRAAGITTIAGVILREGRNVLTRSGSLLEVYRENWQELTMAPGQVNWVMLWPGGVTDWHRHLDQTDHICAVMGAVKLCLHDDREGSPTRGVSNVLRIGALSPYLVIVPPGVWHGFRNESGAPAGFINYFEKPYRHEDPDNWRLPPDTTAIPCRL
jgi:dTDP-4-dehydrorhamnose 3,5-epimerase